MYAAESRKLLNKELPVFLSLQNHGQCYFLSNIMHGRLPTWRAHPRLDILSFYQGSMVYCSYGLTVVYNLSRSFSRLSDDQGLQEKKDIPGMTFQEPRDQLLLAKGKGRMCPWVRLILHYIINYLWEVHSHCCRMLNFVFLLKYIWGSFKVLAVKNSTAVNIRVHISW